MNRGRLAGLVFAFFIPLGAIYSSLFYAAVSLQDTTQLAAIKAREASQVQVTAGLLSSDLAAVTSDLLVIAHSPSLSHFANSGSTSDRAQAAEVFANFVDEKHVYDQIRYLDATGMERIRVNYAASGAVIVPDRQLQDKGERYYFRDSFRLDADEVYVSPLDLNIEHEQIERPYKPMLRLGTPIYNSAGVKTGVVVTNIFGAWLLDHFKRGMVDQRHAMLINRDGYWLNHPDPRLAWGFMLGNDHSVARLYPGAWDIILAQQEGNFTTDAGLFTFTTINLKRASTHSPNDSAAPHENGPQQQTSDDDFWKVVSLVPQRELPDTTWTDHPYLFGTYLTGLGLLALAIASLTATVVNRRKLRHAVFENEIRLREITSTLGEGVYVLDRNGIVTFVNPETERLLGWSSAELVGKNGHDTFHYRTPTGEPLSSGECAVHKTINTGHVYHSLNDWLIRKDETVLPVSLVSTPIMRQGVVVGSVAAFQDITPRLETERALRESEARFRSAMEQAPIGMSMVSVEGRFLEVNRALCEISGYTREELLQRTFLDITHPDDIAESKECMQKVLRGEIGTAQLEKRYVRSDNKTVWVQITGSLLRDSDGKPLYFLVQAEDISERKQSQDQVRQMAYYDTLTGLPNRRLFLDRLNQALAQAKRYQRSLGVMFIDLDHFKQINDTLGHDCGDQLLQVVAARLRKCVRESDTVARQSGDEFVVVLTEIVQPHDAVTVADKIIAAMHEPVDLQGHNIGISVSIGIAHHSVGAADDTSALMKKADVAMYDAKAAGRNGYRIYGEE